MRQPNLWALTLCALIAAACGRSPAGTPTPSEKRERLARAEALFQERCKSAGEKIYRTAENVEGVFLMKVRPEEINFGDQFRMDDPYGRDLGGEGFIGSFLRGEFQATHIDIPNTGSPFRQGYLYVEAVDSKGGRRYRYTGRTEEPWQTDKHYLKGYIRFVLDKVLATGAPPRYGVTYDDISTREEREYWIAGSSLRVIDLQTNEVMAERTGYMMDRGQGARVGGRSPWLLAADHACPMFWHRHGARSQPYQTLDFVEKVLRPLEK